MARKKVTISLHNETMKLLDARAEANMLSRSVLVEVALKRFFEELGDIEDSGTSWLEKKK